MTQKRKRIILGIVGVAIFAGILLVVRVVWGWRWEAIHPGHDTTRVMGPMHADGRVDYVAAFNEAQSRGVTMENNAFAVVREIFDPSKVMATGQEELIERLHGFPPIAPGGKSGKFFQSFSIWMRDKKGPPKAGEEKWPQEWFAREDAARQYVWKKDDDPELAEWLEGERSPLDLLVEASRRERWYVPATVRGDESSFFEALLPPLGAMRGACNSLVMRAMLRLGAGDAAGCDADLMTVHRMGRLMMQDPRTMAFLAGVSIVAVGAEGDAHALAYGLSDAEAKKWQAERAALAPIPDTAAVFDVGERLTALSVLTNINRFGVDNAMGHASSGSERPRAGVFEFGWFPAHFDSVLQDANTWFDRLSTAAKLPTYTARKELFDDIAADQNRLRNQSMKGSATTILKGYVVDVLMENPAKFSGTRDQSQIKFDLAKTAFALAIFKSRTGAYPEKLAELTGQDAAEIPKDLFAGAPFMYRKNGGGYLLYSVGVNLVDDNGVRDVPTLQKGPTDLFAKPAPLVHDDIAIRIEK